VEHEGGVLRVANGYKERKFDFSGQDPSFTNIQWAAFFADCEHEIEPVRTMFFYPKH